MSQLGTPLGGRGKKFRVNLTQNLRAELPQMERDKLVAEWCRLVGREDKVAQLAPVSLGITTDVTPLKIVGLNNYS